MHESDPTHKVNIKLIKSVKHETQVMVVGVSYFFPEMQLQSKGGRGVGRGNLGVILVQVCEPVFQNLPTPFIYLAFEKMDPFIYLIIQNVDQFIYCPLIFCTHFLLVVRQISQSIHVIPRG